MKESQIDMSDAIALVYKMYPPEHHKRMIEELRTAHQVDAARMVMNYAGRRVTIMPDRSTDDMFILRTEDIEQPAPRGLRQMLEAAGELPPGGSGSKPPRPPWFPADPDREVLFEFNGRDLRVMTVLSIGNLARNIRENFTPQEVALLVHLLTQDDPEPEPEPEPEGDGGKGGEAAPGDQPDELDLWCPYDCEHCHEGCDPSWPIPDRCPFDCDTCRSGEPPEGDDDDWEEGDTPDEAEPDDEGDGGAGPGEGAEGVEEDERGEVPTWSPPKREQEEYTDEILKSLAALGVDPSQL